MQTQVLGLSVDSVPCLKAWAKHLGGISYPLLSDFFPHGRVAEMYGILGPEGKARRTIIVIDKQGLIRYLDVRAIPGPPDNDILLQVLTDIADGTVQT